MSVKNNTGRAKQSKSKKRKSIKNPELEKWLIDAGISPGDIKERFSLKQIASVSQWKGGLYSSERMKQFCIDRGCPSGCFTGGFVKRSKIAKKKRR